MQSLFLLAVCSYENGEFYYLTRRLECVSRAQPTIFVTLLVRISPLLNSRDYVLVNFGSLSVENFKIICKNLRI